MSDIEKDKITHKNNLINDFAENGMQNVSGFGNFPAPAEEGYTLKLEDENQTHMGIPEHKVKVR